MADAARITAHLQQVASGPVQRTAVVIVCSALAGATARIDALRADGAGDILVLALGAGTGPLPEGDDVTCVICPGPLITSIAEEIPLWQQFVDDPPAEARDALAAFDPAGDALVVCQLPVTLDSYAGRTTLGGRPPAYTALEDKTLSAQLWHDAGVPHSPEAVVPVSRDALLRTLSQLDQGHGTVWSADASDGINGGADRVFWVRDEATAATAYDALRGCAERARLMPFLEGVPCSIHGIVLSDGVAVLRPVELVVLRRPGSAKFVYAGISTGWDPAPSDRAAMRDGARAVGETLRARHGYRGAFGIDGVMTVDGFRPHELNPRFTGGINAIAKGLPDLPLNRLHDLVLRGGDIGVSATDLEDVVLTAADERRYGSAYVITRAVRPIETTSEPVDGGTLEVGPHLAGGLVRYVPDLVRPGQRLAPTAVEMFAAADQRWGTGLGPLSAAPDVR
ncbi:hypothetical protein [Luteipulveratus halotolerans]|uniref:hypothetical protein n=1 Tax=Luteipulveratus halotolerans TaxID=1631356 RepID=UPI0006816001|nr:hypothetical protein [Luteipulveratus halotolerans]